jgi:hypothetical protein
VYLSPGELIDQRWATFATMRQAIKDQRGQQRDEQHGSKRASDNGEAPYSPKTVTTGAKLGALIAR